MTDLKIPKLNNNSDNYVTTHLKHFIPTLTYHKLDVPVIYELFSDISSSIFGDNSLHFPQLFIGILNLQSKVSLI